MVTDPDAPAVVCVRGAAGSTGGGGRWTDAIEDRVPDDGAADPARVREPPEVERVVRESGVREGLVLVNPMHITASVFINDDEAGLHGDYDRWLERLAPHAPIDQYRHNDTGEDNADAHLKRQVMGREVVVAVTAGRLDLGRWEQIFYGEFDGRRRKRVLVKVLGE
jgi:secondary thiamine-phosphate synthase enzyme